MSVLEIRGVPLPDRWQLDPATIKAIYRMRRHQIDYAANVWREAEALVNQHYHRPATSGASSFLEAS